MKKIFKVIMLCILLSSCTTRVATMTAISNRNVKTQHVKINQLPKTKNIVGESKKFWFLFIPFGINHIDEALDDALIKGDGDLMIDGSLYYTWWSCGLISRDGYELRGTVVKTKEGI